MQNYSFRGLQIKVGGVSSKGRKWGPGSCAPAAIFDFIFVQYFGILVCRTFNLIHMPNFVQILQY